MGRILCALDTLIHIWYNVSNPMRRKPDWQFFLFRRNQPEIFACIWVEAWLCTFLSVSTRKAKRKRFPKRAPLKGSPTSSARHFSSAKMSDCAEGRSLTDTRMAVGTTPTRGQAFGIRPGKWVAVFGCMGSLFRSPVPPPSPLEKVAREA